MQTNLSAKICGCYGCSQTEWCDVFQMDSFYVYGCPCRKCLLKMLCEDICKTYQRFNQKVYRDKNFIMNMRKNKREMRIAYKRNLLRERI